MLQVIALKMLQFRDVTHPELSRSPCCAGGLSVCKGRTILWFPLTRDLSHRHFQGSFVAQINFPLMPLIYCCGRVGSRYYGGVKGKLIAGSCAHCDNWLEKKSISPRESINKRIIRIKRIKKNTNRCSLAGIWKKKTFSDQRLR